MDRPPPLNLSGKTPPEDQFTDYEHGLADGRAEAAEEIRKLRDEVGDHVAWIENLKDEIARLQAENEQLRARIARIETTHADSR